MNQKILEWAITEAPTILINCVTHEIAFCLQTEIAPKQCVSIPKYDFGLHISITWLQLIIANTLLIYFSVFSCLAMLSIESMQPYNPLTTINFGYTFNLCSPYTMSSLLPYSVQESEAFNWKCVIL